MQDDTAPSVARRYHALLGALSGQRRIEMAAGLSRSVRELCEAGLRARHPSAGDEEIRWRVAAVCYGEALATRVFGEPPGTRR